MTTQAIAHILARMLQGVQWGDAKITERRV